MKSLMLVLLLNIPLLANKNPNQGSRDLLFDQQATGLYGIYPSWNEAAIADNFMVPYWAEIDSLVWWGGYINGSPTPPIDFWIKVFPDSSGYNQPCHDPIYEECYDVYTEINLGAYYQYELYLTIPFQADPAEIYWIASIATMVFPPAWGNNGSFPSNNPGWGDGQESYFRGEPYGYPQWTPATTVWGEPIESSFQIFGSAVGVDIQKIEAVENSDFAATIFSGPLLLPEGKKCRVYDVTGRTVVPQHIKPGVYFIEIDNKIVQKVVKIR